MKIKIASPCSARWEDMSGDERSRFCQHCQKHVYNFALMNRNEIQTLIQQKEGKVCARIYRRKDGTVLTNDCPIGLSQVATRVKFMIYTATAALLLSIGLSKAADSYDEFTLRRIRRSPLLFWYRAKSMAARWWQFEPPTTGRANMITPTNTPSGTNLLLGEVAPEQTEPKTVR